jgi:hypothetical protein
MAGSFHLVMRNERMVQSQMPYTQPSKANVNANTLRLPIMNPSPATMASHSPMNEGSSTYNNKNGMVSHFTGKTLTTLKENNNLQTLQNF